MPAWLEGASLSPWPELPSSKRQRSLLAQPWWWEQRWSRVAKSLLVQPWSSLPSAAPGFGRPLPGHSPQLPTGQSVSVGLWSAQSG